MWRERSIPRAFRAALIEAEDGILHYRYPAPPGVLGDLPVHVLSAASWFDLPDPPGPPPPWAEEFTHAWDRMQDSLAVLSANTEHVRVPGAGHAIPWYAPDVVIRAARTVVETVRSGQAGTHE